MQTKTEILHWLDESPSAARFVAAAGKLDALTDVSLPEVRIAILRNLTIEPVLPYLKVECYRLGLRPQIFCGEFDNAQQEAVNPRGALYAFKPDAVIVALRWQGLAPRLADRFTSLSPATIEDLANATIDTAIRTITAIRAASPALVLVHNFEEPLHSAGGILSATLPSSQINLVRQMNLDLAKAVADQPNCYVVDLAHALGRVGYDRGLDDRYWHMARAPYSPAVLELLAKEYSRFIRPLKGRGKKCLVLDCDNTLWGGIIGEDGMAGIQLGVTHPGSAFLAFQSAVLELHDRGIVLAICSKNNEPDVLEVLKHHPDCLLRPDHFACMKINWSDKATNLRAIAAELNLGLDAFVFVDDSPFECELVRQTLPEVTVLPLPQDPTQYERLLRGLGLFDALTVTAEDRQRNRLYRSEAQRRDLQSQSQSLDEYLKSLEMRLTIRRAEEFHIPRIAQLTQRTNQFNLTTRRYSEGEIRELNTRPDSVVYWAQLTDRFDDMGIIGLAIVRFAAVTATLDCFLLSCRVLSRGVEDALLAHMATIARARGCERLAAEYIPTPKNGLAAEFLPSHSFTKMESDPGTVYALDLTASAPRPPAWFHQITTD